MGKGSQDNFRKRELIYSTHANMPLLHGSTARWTGIKLHAYPRHNVAVDRTRLQIIDQKDASAPYLKN